MLLKRARRQLSGVLEKLGYDRRSWLRAVQIESWKQFLGSQRPLRDMLEISPGWKSPWAEIDGRAYRAVSFPEFDVTRHALDERFQIVIADQILEHVADPLAAVRNIRKMVRPGGYALVATPFLFRIHRRPRDCWRWTEEGLRILLETGGFAAQDIKTHSWGNERCVRAHLWGPIKRIGFGRDLSNNPEYPVMVWAFARG